MNTQIVNQIEKQLNIKLKKVEEIKLDTIGYTVDQQSNITSLGLYDCKINDLNLIIEQINFLKELTELYLFQNQISDISPLKDLKKLKILCLAKNKISNISALKDLKELKILYLAANKISYISALKGLNNLTELNLSYNTVLDISALKDLKNITKLILRDNPISDISVLEVLKNLKILSLMISLISDISALKNLKNLTKLYLSAANIIDISALKDLENLTELSLSHNKISDISALKDLKNLVELSLTNNEISDISALKDLKNLTSLDLTSNTIKNLPIWICNFPKMNIQSELYPLGKGDDYIILDNNPIESPPIEIVKQGKEAIVNYFDQLEESDYLFEAKLILIGEERAGKSTIAKALCDDYFKINPNEKSTEGIEILKWEISKTITKTDKDFVFNIWDFGGQEIYHSTHQFFLTKRSLYLFVSEARKDIRFDDFYYWLNIVNSLAKNSPIIVIQNKSDQTSNETNISEYRKLFPQIITELQRVSCNTKHEDWKKHYQPSLDMLKNNIYDIIKNNQIEGIGAKLPKAWITIKNEISELQQQNINYINYQNYNNICKQHGLDDKKAEFLSDYFHDLGVFLHFKHDIQLRNTIFLNHKYVTKGIYKVFDNKKIIANYGKFTNKDLIEIWNEPKFVEKQAELLNLLKTKEFKICFQHKNGYYLAPQLFSDAKPEIEWRTYEDNLIFYYSYQFLPKGFLSQIIVMLNQYIYKDNYWKYGVLLEYKKSRALISEKRFKNENTISIRVEGALKRDLLVLIGNEIEEINKSFTNLNVSEVLACNCKDCSKSDNPYSWRLETINRAMQKSKKTMECQKSFEEVEINSLLGNYIPCEQLSKCQTDRKNIITIYGNQNTVLQDIKASNIEINKIK